MAVEEGEAREKHSEAVPAVMKKSVPAVSKLQQWRSGYLHSVRCSASPSAVLHPCPHRPLCGRAQWRDHPPHPTALHCTALDTFFGTDPSGRASKRRCTWCLRNAAALSAALVYRCWNICTNNAASTCIAPHTHPPTRTRSSR